MKLSYNKLYGKFCRAKEHLKKSQSISGVKTRKIKYLRDFILNTDISDSDKQLVIEKLKSDEFNL